MSEEKESKKPLFQCIHEKVSMKWKGFSEKTQTFIGIVLIILLGGIACSPILVFSSFNFLSSIPIFYKILAFVVFSVLFLKYYFKLTIKTISKQSKTLKTFYGWDDAIAVLLLIYGIYSFSMEPTVSFLKEFRAELLGAGIATLLIGNASQAAQIQEEKKRLILQMASPDNGFAIEAVRQLRQQGWLMDGSLKGANLYRANLSGADLKRANLSGATLRYANLSGTIMQGANLKGANLREANLSAAFLRGANLSAADLSWANLSGADLVTTNFSEAIFTMAILNGANLKAVNFSGAKLYDEHFYISARFNQDTKWEDVFYTDGEEGTVFPEGFNLSEYKMHLIHKGENYDEAFKRVNPFDVL